MKVNTCIWCNKALPAMSSPKRKFCNTSCKGHYAYKYSGRFHHVTRKFNYQRVNKHLRIIYAAMQLEGKS